MYVNNYKYSIEILALNQPGNFLIEVVGKNSKAHCTVGPRDSLQTTIGKIEKKMEALNGGDTRSKS